VLLRSAAQSSKNDGEEAMKLHVIKPSVNNMSVRVFARAAGLDVEEVDAYGQTRSAEFLKACPAHLTPMLESGDLAGGALWESCAIMQYLCNKHGLTQFYPSDPAARARQDSAMFYLIGTLYPLVARAAYPRLGFPLYPGEVGASDASDDAKEAARQAAENALGEVLEVYRTYFLAGQPFIGGDSPSIADIRLAATVEFLRITDFEFPAWLEAYMSGVAAALGEAYAEPVADVRGYIDHVRSQQV
jgi:glutathione S-transferase